MSTSSMLTVPITGLKKSCATTGGPMARSMDSATSSLAKRVLSSRWISRTCSFRAWCASRRRDWM
ncbi:hypothetical protein EYF80_041925 [Liparis tanakae]|uniref:Uncharacterized protein n=1 Tax=Liparis tanakae TaxID=230148 RepID=A0A4Z2G507_9TELE|nr:hypothetical protein EYF80_041925 [Liparis tanakae]